MGTSEMSARNPNDHRPDEDKERLAEPTDEVATPLHPRVAGAHRMMLSQVPVLFNQDWRTKPTTPLLSTNKPQKKKKFRETFMEESSWLVYSSYSNHELLRSFFSLLQNFRPACQTDFPHLNE